jgi:energy-coupling factor transporter ATP-binding protein EcfA2
MKLAKITLKDFRGFSNEETFNLADGKNLLLYGENGSGKSSLYRAIVEFFNRKTDAKPFRVFRNVFLSGPTKSSIDGHVTLETSGGTQYEWRCLGDRPWRDKKLAKDAREQLADAANRAALLDYRSLLRTNFGALNLRGRLFELAVNTLLVNAPVAVPGGRERTIGQLWAALRSTVPGHRERHTKSRLASIASAEKMFNDALMGILPDVQKRAAEFLSYFDDSFLELKLGFQGVNYHQASKNFSGGELDFEVKLHGVTVPEWNDLLNEARLTALALALYLAGATLANTTPPVGAATPLRLLALDDVLIGLDLAHRLPILRIIEERLPDFQVLLLTHDRVWFDLAQLSVSNPDNWICYEMYSREVRDADVVFDAPVLKPQTEILPGHFITLAKVQLANPNHDYRAAALYARAALEVKLKSYCSSFKVQVPYDLDGRNLNTDHFLNAIERRFLWSGTGASSLFQLRRVKLFREGVLNPSAHFHPVTLAKGEVEEAIRAVELLDFPKKKDEFAKKASELLGKPVLTQVELIDAACYLRTAFETDLRSLLVRYGGTINFRDDWAKIELAELWNSAKVRMSALNNGLAVPLIVEIEAHSLLFLDEWKYSSVRAMTKADLDAAWGALRAAIPPGAPRTRLAAFA